MSGARTLLATLVVAVRVGAAIAQPLPPPCPQGGATLSVFADNRSNDPAVVVDLTGDLLDPASTCVGDGTTSYAATFTCTGAGVVHCGEVSALRPGAWVHRIAATVTGSDPQRQARRSVVVAGGPDGVRNFLVWTIHPRTFVVPDTSEASLRTILDAAAAFTAGGAGPALVTFSPGAFPGADAPATIDLTRGPCAPDPTRHAGLCITGSRIVVDALDASGAPGGVVWSAGEEALALVRLYGSDDVLRGLVLAGTTVTAPSAQFDTVAIVGAGAQRNRIEQSVVRGPTRGDGIGVEGGAEAEVDASEVSGAADKGVKVTTGGRAVVRASCIHDNRNGGIQATLGGNALAVENLVQHNVAGGASNGLSATGGVEATTALATVGNVVRFAGGRGLSVTDNAITAFDGDYVADNQFVGAKVETTTAGPAGSVPQALFHGVAFVCNHNAGVSGSCTPQSGDEATPCGTDEDCCGSPDGCCVTDPECGSPLTCGPGSFPLGFGAVENAAAGRPAPDTRYGDATEAGHNAFALNRNAPLGANFAVSVLGAHVPAAGNQWEHCGTAPACDVPAILAQDVRLADGASVELGQPIAPRAGTPTLTDVSPRRPRRGDLVRVFGGGFNAIEAAACAGETAPADPCSAANPAVMNANTQTNANRVRLISDPDVLATLYPDAVTPTMLAFRMPFDCHAPLTLEVAKRTFDGSRLTASITLCDPEGCAGQPADLPCDDGDACTANDRCTGGAESVCAGTAIACAGVCLTGACDPAVGCVPRPASAACDDGDACTAGDHCSGDADACLSGAPRSCAAPCGTGVCVPARGCEPRPAGTVCRPAAGVCDVGETCNGQDIACPADVKRTEVCRAAARACDVAERCDGVHDGCPTDGAAPDGTACDDGDQCTTDACAGGACAGVPLPGFALAICELAELVAAPPCEIRDAALASALAGRLEAADRLLRRAETAPRRRARRLLHRVDRSLAAAARAVDRAVFSGRLDAACGGMLTAAIEERRARVRGLRPR